MLRSFYLSFTVIGLLFVSVVLNGQSFVKYEGGVLTLDNGVVFREILIDNGNRQLYSKTLGFSGKDFNYIDSGLTTFEFRFQVYGIPYSGMNQWEVSDVVEVEDKHGGSGAMVKLKGIGILSVLEINISYLLYPDLPLIRKQLAFKNHGEQDIMLEGIDVEAVTLQSYPTSSELYTHYARNKHIGPYVGNWEDPVIALHLPEVRRGIVLGNEAPGVLKRIAFYADDKDFCAGLTKPDQEYPFRKWLGPGEGYESPSVFLMLYKDASDPYFALNFTLPYYVKNYMGLKIFELDYKPVFVYNTWNPFRHDVNAKLIGELAEAAEDCGIQEFVIDDGWQTNTYTDHDTDAPWWYTQVGDYLIDELKFPGGLKPVFKDIRKRGMKPGLWLSIGSANISSAVYREKPEWFVKGQNGALANLHTPSDTTMRTACMSTNWTDHIRDIILELVDDHGLSYTKLDFAAVSSAYVSDPELSGCYATDHPGHRDHHESLGANYEGLFGLFDELQIAAPDLFIDCTFETQGKLHLIDYGFMKHAEGNWLSNIEEASPIGALRVRHLAWERTPVLPAACCLVGNLRLDSEDLEFDFFSLIGTFPIMLGDIRKTAPEDRVWLKNWSDWLQEMQRKYDYMSYRQDLRGFGEPGEARWDGWQRINTESREGGIVGIFRQGSAESQRMITVQGLDPDQEYIVFDPAAKSEIGAFSGKDLASFGFRVEMLKNYQGRIFEIRSKS